MRPSTKGGRGEMTKAPISLQDLRRRLYAKAKAEPSWRFWGLFVHVCKMETLQAAYEMAKANNGAPGIDGVTFKDIKEAGEEDFLKQIREELLTGTYQPHARPVNGTRKDEEWRSLGRRYRRAG
jgi:RNA-directed DNA polymerase